MISYSYIPMLKFVSEITVKLVETIYIYIAMIYNYYVAYPQNYLATKSRPFSVFLL